jgi:hypothetical protein
MLAAALLPLLGVVSSGVRAPGPSVCGPDVGLRAVAPATETTVTLTWTLREEHTQRELQRLTDGEGAPPVPAPESTVETREVVVSEHHHEGDGGERTIRRAFDTTVGHHDWTKTAPDGDLSAEQTLTTELAGRQWTLTSDDQAWAWVAADDGPALELDPAALRGELSFAAWLPADPEATEWTVPAAALDELLAPGGDLGWHVVDDELHEPGDAGPEARYEGTIRARRTTFETDAPHDVVIALEIDVEVTRDLLPAFRLRAERQALQSGGQPADEQELTEVRHYEGKGRVVWDTAEDRLRSLSAELPFDEVWRRRFVLALPSFTKTYELIVRSTGRTTASVGTKHTSE